MDKKNTMLLTVIAVATLLVAVVGATFAFFSLSTKGESTTTGTVTTDSVGTATIANTEEYLTLSLTTDDMAQYNEDKTYYAVSGQTDNGGEHGNETPIKIAKATYSGGTADTSYKCPVQVKVTVDGDMLDTLEEGWTLLELSGDAVNAVQGVGPDNNSLDLAKLKKDVDQGPEVEKSQTFKGTITLNGPTDNIDILSASVSLKNLKSTDQSAIANTTLTVKVNVTPDGDCTVVTD